LTGFNSLNIIRIEEFHKKIDLRQVNWSDTQKHRNTFTFNQL